MPLTRERVALDPDPWYILRRFWLALELHVRVLGRPIVLAVVAAHARADQILPGRGTAFALRQHVIDGHHPLALEVAVLAGVVVAQQHVLLGERDLLHRALDVVEHPDDRRQLHLVAGRLDDLVAPVDDLGLPREQQLHGALERGDVERLVGEVQDQDVVHDLSRERGAGS